VLHIRRHRRVEAVVFFGRGMDEAEVPRVEGLAFEIGDGDADGFFGGLVGTRIGALLAVKRRLFFPVIGRAGEAGRNPARSRLWRAAHETGIDAVNGMFRKLLGQALMRAVRLGDIIPSSWSATYPNAVQHLRGLRFGSAMCLSLRSWSGL